VETTCALRDGIEASRDTAAIAGAEHDPQPRCTGSALMPWAFSASAHHCREGAQGRPRAGSPSGDVRSCFPASSPTFWQSLVDAGGEVREYHGLAADLTDWSKSIANDGFLLVALPNSRGCVSAD
jgi:hypothetical protein